MLKPFEIQIKVSSDLVDGNKKIFERIWKLVLKAEKWNSTKDTRIQESTDLKQIDLNKTIYKVRNKQLSMVGVSSFFSIDRIRDLFEYFNSDRFLFF